MLPLYIRPCFLSDVGPYLLWDPAFPSVRPCHLWNHAAPRLLQDAFLGQKLLWRLAFSDTLPSVLFTTFTLICLPSEWGLAFLSCETLLDLWDPAISYVPDPSFFRVWHPAFCHMRDPLLPYVRPYLLSHVRPCFLSHVKFCLLSYVRPCLLWDPAFFHMLGLAFSEALQSVRACDSVRPSLLCLLWDLAFVHNVGPSVRPCFLWDLAFCEALPSVRTCPASVRARPSSNMWDLASVWLCLCFTCENMPCVSPCCEWHTLLSVKLCPLWDLAFRETLASVRPCLLWDPGLCEALPSVRPWLCLFYDTLPSVRLCLCLMVSVFCEAVPLCETICETWPSWDPGFCEALLWDPGFCEALPSVRPFLLWDPGFVYFMIPCLLGDPPLFNGRDPVFCEALPFCETLPSLMCETLPSV